MHLDSTGWLPLRASRKKAKEKEARLVKREKCLLKKYKIYPVKEGSVSYATLHCGRYKS